MIPDSFFGAVIVTALLVCAILFGRGQNSASRTQCLAWPLGVGLAFLVGAVVYSGHPRWPLQQNEDRFLACLIPLATLVETLGQFSKAWLVWPGRILVAVATVPILLYGSAYFETWTTPQTVIWVGGLAACLMIAWVSLDLQIRHLPPRTVLFGLAGVNAGAGIVVMLEGYASGGPLAMILAVALCTTAAVSPQTIPRSALSGAAGIGLVGLFALLVSGHFFASLGLDHAAILLAIPLLGWLLAWPRIQTKSLLRLAVLCLQALWVAGVVGLAYKRSEEPEPQPPVVNNADDYSPADLEQFKGPNK